MQDQPSFLYIPYLADDIPRGSSPTDLRANLVNCNNLAWETFVEAEEKLEKLRETISMITGRCGIVRLHVGDSLDDANRCLNR